MNGIDVSELIAEASSTTNTVLFAVLGIGLIAAAIGILIGEVHIGLTSGCLGVSVGCIVLTLQSMTGVYLQDADDAVIAHYGITVTDDVSGALTPREGKSQTLTNVLVLDADGKVVRVEPTVILMNENDVITALVVDEEKKSLPLEPVSERSEQEPVKVD